MARNLLSLEDEDVPDYLQREMDMYHQNKERGNEDSDQYRNEESSFYSEDAIPPECED